jgi:hypothetical protein
MFEMVEGGAACTENARRIACGPLLTMLNRDDAGLAGQLGILLLTHPSHGRWCAFYVQK